MVIPLAWRHSSREEASPIKLYLLQRASTNELHTLYAAHHAGAVVLGKLQHQARHWRNHGSRRTPSCDSHGQEGGDASRFTVAQERSVYASFLVSHIPRPHVSHHSFHFLSCCVFLVVLFVHANTNIYSVEGRSGAIKGPWCHIYTHMGFIDQ